jgi:hypothetical protein
VVALQITGTAAIAKSNSPEQVCKYMIYNNKDAGADLELRLDAPPHRK